MGETAKAQPQQAGAIETLVPARLDRLPWTRFHTMLVVALGVTWVLDGLEVTLKGAVSGVLQEPRTLHFSSAEIGLIASFYLTGAVIGSLVFGYLTDRFGRRLFFFVTLATYLTGALLTAFSWDLASFILFRFITGAGIGGEYAAINSAIDEMIPARLRGRIDIYINGSYWIGAAVGAGSTLVFLDPRLFSVDVGWRIGFGIGAVLGLGILLVRRFVPESPRWLITRGYAEQAEATTQEIEALVDSETGHHLPRVDPANAIVLHPRRSFGFGVVISTMFGRYWRRALTGFALMVSQAFLYNAIFFTYALVLTRFYQVPSSSTGLFLLPFAVGNFLGVISLGALFDTVGRVKMIAGTYAVSALLLALTGLLFAQGQLTAVTQTALWTAIFFIASPAASSAYLTVSEIFPLETRALAIAFFYSLGTAAGGIAAPWLFGVLIGTGSPWAVCYGYWAAALLMLAAAFIEIVFGIAAERVSLEKLAEPLAAAPRDRAQ
ncbi:MAG TPA: MFS transporter [Pseudolabrys sp.]|nr:MFS transporter [Pseudolabrys sp.]